MVDDSTQLSLEQRLRASEERFTQFSDASLDGIALLDGARILDVNGTLASMLGYTTDELVGMAPTELTIPEERERLVAHIRSGSAAPIVGTALRKDGSTLPVEVHGRSLQRGERHARVVVIRDISSQLRADEEVRAGAARLRLVLEQIPAIVWTTDRELQLTSLRGRGLATYAPGSEERFLGRRLRDLVGGGGSDRSEGGARLLAAHDDALAGRSASYYIDWQGLRWHAHVEPLRDADDAVVGVVGLAVDVSEPHRLADALSESEERYRALVDAMPDGVAVHAGGSFVFLNPVGARLLGASSAEELVGRPILNFVHPDSIARAEADLRQLATQGRPITGARYRLVRLDGSGVDVELSATALEYNGQQAVQVVCRDITDRLQAEASLRAAELQLQESQKLEAVGRLAGGIAHDFNNLLTVISSFTQMALDGLGEQDPMRRDLLEVRHAAGRAAELTGQLLAFSRKQPTQPVVLDVNAVVQKVERMLRRIIGHGIELRLHLGQRPAVVRADAGHLEQVFMNLVLNARDAMPEGGIVTIATSIERLKPEQGRTMVGAEVTPGRYVRIDVADTGVGMNEETRSRLFEPFFTTKPTGEGTGLGLPVVYGMVKQSGGYIAVESAPGRGATFSLFLPFVEESAATTPVAETSGADGGSETVLVAEDEPALRSVVRRILESAGYRVLLAEDGRTALRLARSSPDPIDLLLSDLIMPGMNGHELARQFATEHPRSRILLMSGYSDDAALRQRSEHEVVQKPFSRDELTRRVRAVLDGAMR